MSWDKLKYHIDKKHPKHGEKTYFCDICKKGFVFKASIEVHKRLRHQKQYECKCCNLQFPMKKNLKNHMGKVHTKKEEDRGGKCEICFIEFTSKFELKEHRIKNHQRFGNYGCEMMKTFLKKNI